MKFKTDNCLLFILLFVSLIGCNSVEQKNGADHVDTVTYVLNTKQDTGQLVLKHTRSTFRGVLKINYNSTYTDSGDVRGAIKGDTLVGDFSYQHYGLPKWIREPIIFLKKDGKLIMGKGATVFTAGIPHFDPTVPIDFHEESRLIFRLK